eukprot:505491-Pelagomonas_calceolata.AAC.1
MGPWQLTGRQSTTCSSFAWLNESQVLLQAQLQRGAGCSHHTTKGRQQEKQRRSQMMIMTAQIAHGPHCSHLVCAKSIPAESVVSEFKLGMMCKLIICIAKKEVTIDGRMMCDDVMLQSGTSPEKGW